MKFSAKLCNDWRVVPRLLLAGAGYFTVSVSTDLIEWYQILPEIERTVPTAGMITGIITILTGFTAQRRD